MDPPENLELARQADRVELAAFIDMYAAAPPEARARIEQVADATLLIAPALPLGLFNRAIGLATARAVSDREIGEIVDRFEAAGSSKYFIHAGPASDPALVPLLQAQGFALGEPPYWAKTALLSEPEPLSTDLDARPIEKDEAPRFAEVICAALGMPSFMNLWIQSLTARTGWTAFAAFDGEAMVAGGMRWQGGEGAWLGMAGTLAEARGRGAQGAILRARSRGAGGLVITETWLPPPGGHNTSLANMHRAGFVTIAERANYQKASMT
jgi:hypothetical protein